MDLAFTPEQHAVRDLAHEIFARMCTDERLRQSEAGPERLDLALWAELERGGLLDFGVADGSGGGILEVCLILEEAGRFAAALPLWAPMVGVLVLGARPNVVTIGFGAGDGVLEMVPAAGGAQTFLACLPDGVYQVEPTSIEPQTEPGREPIARVRYSNATRIDADAVRARDLALVALCALQTGICDAAVRLTASYLTTREQFGRPLGTFQAVQQRAGDAYIDVEVMRWSMWHAAWKLAQNHDASEDAAIAKYWASEGAARALAAAQHLHGGMGVDMDYPLHRYTFLARQTELALGGAWEQLARIGEMIAR